MIRLLSSLLIQPLVTVDVDVDLFTFTNGLRTQSFEPSLSVSPDRVILAVGQKSAEPDSLYIRLFHDSMESVRNSDLLESFLRHGVSTVISGPIVRRPRFEFLVSPQFSRHTKGFYDPILRSAALQAGASNDKDIQISLK